MRAASSLLAVRTRTPEACLSKLLPVAMQPLEANRQQRVAVSQRTVRADAVQPLAVALEVLQVLLQVGGGRQRVALGQVAVIKGQVGCLPLAEVWPVGAAKRRGAIPRLEP